MTKELVRYGRYTDIITFLNRRASELKFCSLIHPNLLQEAYRNRMDPQPIVRLLIDRFEISKPVSNSFFLYYTPDYLVDKKCKFSKLAGGVLSRQAGRDRNYSALRRLEKAQIVCWYRWLLGLSEGSKIDDDCDGSLWFYISEGLDHFSESPPKIAKILWYRFHHKKWDTIAKYLEARYSYEFDPEYTKTYTAKEAIESMKNK